MTKLLEIAGKKFFFDGKNISTTLPPFKLLKFFFSKSELKKSFNERLEGTATKGLDRTNGFRFSLHLDEHVAVVSRKSLSGQYRFTPYLQVLQTKGRDKYPRVIGIATVRDRLVLHQIKDLLSFTFPESIPKSRANTLIHQISREIKTIVSAGKTADTMVFNCDIKSFYDNIDREVLIKSLAGRVKSKKVISLIGSAINSPTVPRDYRRENIAKYAVAKGVPQGLSISNILAAIYLSEFDKTMRGITGIHYYRYVDDLLIFGDATVVASIPARVENELKLLGLEIHPIGSGKTHLVNLSERFDYLGYRFEAPLVTVRDATIERFLQSIIGKFSEYTHNKRQRLAKHKHLTEDVLKEIFLLELNERITGAISEKRKYGWISYFSEINDLNLLKRLDYIITGFFSRLPDFRKKAPKGLKTLSRAYFEMRYSPTRGYIHNYDSYVALAAKIKFLNERNRLNPDKTYSDAEIEAIFHAYRNRNLSALQADDGTMY